MTETGHSAHAATERWCQTCCRPRCVEGVVGGWVEEAAEDVVEVAEGGCGPEAAMPVSGWRRGLLPTTAWQR